MAIDRSVVFVRIDILRNVNKKDGKMVKRCVTCEILYSEYLIYLCILCTFLRLQISRKPIKTCKRLTFFYLIKRKIVSINLRSIEFGDSIKRQEMWCHVFFDWNHVCSRASLAEDLVNLLRLVFERGQVHESIFLVRWLTRNQWFAKALESYYVSSPKPYNWVVNAFFDATLVIKLD